jgi:hypothetical protein
MDWLVELAGATMPAAAAAFAAARLAPVEGWPVGSALAVGFVLVFAASYGAMRLIPAEARDLPLQPFEQRAWDEDILLLDQVMADEPLLLDQEEAPLDILLLDQPVIMAATDAVAELLLDDPLPPPSPDSRVVQLFADGRMPTAGQLKRRIDRHLAGSERPAAATAGAPDGADALSAALAELRRSLRQA